MTDYKNGKIYHIICNKTGLCYVGSTTKPLNKRLIEHKCDYKGFLEGKTKYITSFKILENNDYKMLLVEEFPCENKDQLYAREQYYIDSCECVNKVNCIKEITKTQYKTYTPAHARAMKKWRNKNAEFCHEKARSDMSKYRMKWKDYWNESKRLLNIEIN